MHHQPAWKNSTRESEQPQNGASENAKNVIYVDQATYQQLQQQAANGQVTTAQHNSLVGMAMRQVPVQGQMQPPHLSQQAQQMLHSKVQIQ